MNNDYLKDKYNIETEESVFKYMDDKHPHYQPTSYYALDKLINNGFITKNSKVVDYGCGKGRAVFYFNEKTSCKIIGVEFSKEIFDMAQTNLSKYGVDKEIDFVNIEAEEFEPYGYDTFYFFSPFTLDVFKKVIDKILNNATSKFIICYYFNKELSDYVSSVDGLKKIGEINCGKGVNNKLVIYNIDKKF